MTMRMRMLHVDNRLDMNRDKGFPMRQKVYLVLLLVALVMTATSLSAKVVGVDAFSLGTIHTSMPTSTNYSRKRGMLQLHNHNRNDGGDQIEDDTTGGSNRGGLMNLLVAAAVVTANLDPSGISMAKAAETDSFPDLDLVSPGTTSVQIKTGNTGKIVQSTESTLNNLVNTAVWNSKNRNALTESLKRVQSSVQTEVTSVEAWKEVIQILKDYGVALKEETDVVVRPPADLGKTVDELKSKRFNLLVDGEILQIQLDYNKGSNEKDPVQPDDEWILSIRGYKGYDPNALTQKLDADQPKSSYKPPFWYTYSTTPLEETDIRYKFVKTKGQALVVEGSIGLSLAYAVSYAYYLDQLEQEAKAAAEKKKKVAAAAAAKKKAAAAKKKKEAEEEAEESTGRWGRKTKSNPPTPTEKAKPTPSKVTTAPPAAAPKKAPVADDKKPAKKSPPKKPSPTKPAAETKPASATPKPVSPPPPAPAPAKAEKAKSDDKIDTSKDGGDETDVKIEFDKDGKVVIVVTDPTQKGGIGGLVRTLTIPWLGFFVSNSPTSDNRAAPIKFIQSLVFPWAGFFFPKGQTTTKMTFPDED